MVYILPNRAQSSDIDLLEIHKMPCMDLFPQHSDKVLTKLLQGVASDDPNCDARL